ncbi:MAG TPA: heme o synthase [Chitinophagaceae bacterium]|nr:heme o synthase [Chitinophagaceae bacterium]
MKKIKDYLQLIKPSLSIMVVFSSVISYLLAPGIVRYETKMILLLFAGGMLVTGSANAINQVVEKDTDALMKRTAKRPVAAGRMSVEEGWVFAVIMGAAGIFILAHYFNWLSAILALLSLFLYAFIYTPLKKVNSIAVLAGAVPGAMPCLIGWAAGNDQLSTGGWILFGFQFLWQFPHFWAIAWLAYADYARAGFKLLPSREGPTKFSALQTVIYSLLLIPVTLAPFFTGMCSYENVKGIISLGLIMVANLFMIGRCVTLYNKMDAGSARKVMFGSYLYLPIVLLALLLSKS